MATAMGALWAALPVSYSRQRCYVNLGAGRWWYAVYTMPVADGPSRIALLFDHMRGNDADPDTYSEEFEGEEADALHAALAASVAAPMGV